MTRSRYREASEALASQDPVMGGLVERHGPMQLPPPPSADRRFEQLAESIAYQQLAGRAAATIWGRVRALYRPGVLQPADVLATSEADLRAAGLSGAKTAAILDLALHAQDGRLRLNRIGHLDDDEVIARLVQVRGIGRWTAQMFLMFTLGRLDVWPTGDYGVRAGYAKAWSLGAHPTEAELLALGTPFEGARSIVAWYCWRAADSAETGRT
jgi:DNA-3-methyladenine glycosylase II